MSGNGERAAIPEGYEHVANIEAMNGAWLLTLHEIWTRDADTYLDTPLVTEGYEAWSSLAKCKAALRGGFGPLRYEEPSKRLIYVYAKVEHFGSNESPR